MAKTGVKGVFYKPDCKINPYFFTTMVNGVTKNSWFPTLEAAAKAIVAEGLLKDELERVHRLEGCLLLGGSDLLLGAIGQLSARCETHGEAQVPIGLRVHVRPSSKVPAWVHVEKHAGRVADDDEGDQMHRVERAHLPVAPHLSVEA